MRFVDAHPKHAINVLKECMASLINLIGLTLPNGVTYLCGSSLLAEEGLRVFEAAANMLDILSLKFIPDTSLLLEGGPSKLGFLSSNLTRLSFRASLSVSLPELLSAVASLPLLERPVQPLSFPSSLPPSRLVAEL